VFVFYFFCSSAVALGGEGSERINKKGFTGFSATNSSKWRVCELS